jgi:hypothetical protein
MKHLVSPFPPASFCLILLIARCSLQHPVLRHHNY